MGSRLQKPGEMMSLRARWGIQAGSRNPVRRFPDSSVDAAADTSGNGFFVVEFRSPVTRPEESANIGQVEIAIRRSEIYSEQLQEFGA
jgi:hypothetical protein